MAQKITQSQLENYVLERHKLGYEPETVRRLLLVNYGRQPTIKSIVKIILDCKNRGKYDAIKHNGIGKTFTNRIAARELYNHTLEK
jgi:hypothetical protein